MHAAGQQETSWSVFGVHGTFDCAENVRNLLPFVEEHRFLIGAESCVRIASVDGGVVGPIQTNG